MSTENIMQNFSFPLYDMLNTADIPNHEMTSVEKDTLVGLIEALDIEGKESILLLIKKFQAIQKLDSDKLPYGGKKTKRDIKFDISDMPNNLRHILMKFAILHKERMDENKIRETLS